MDTWAKLIEEGKEVAAIALDQSSTYDPIDHPILLKKNADLGLPT